VFWSRARADVRIKLPEIIEPFRANGDTPSTVVGIALIVCVQEPRFHACPRIIFRQGCCIHRLHATTLIVSHLVYICYELRANK
jgi:hypothetical protein